MARQFLSAQWRDLILASYAVDASLLEPLIPKGLELDLFEGQAVCSLVGFMFLDTRVLGVPWPGYRNFPEINLRFYVREQSADRRGVVFVRELVRSRFVAMVARGLYNEPYVKANITSDISESEDRHVQYNFGVNDGQGLMRVRSAIKTSVPSEDSTEHWFKEHQWGYGQTRRGTPLIYEVQHPHWACHQIQESEINVDTGAIYGDQWAFLQNLEPVSVVHAAGSAIKVFGAQRLESQAE
jgi:uncharacterized protein YqjF (DUF2071 family)